MKKTISLVLAFALVIALSVAGTVAYLQDKETVTNTFTVGNVNITLDEAPVELDETTGQYVEVKGDRRQQNTYETLVPGQKVPKDPTVTNVGKNAAWVRVDVTLTDYSVFKEAVKEGTDLTSFFGGFDATKWTLVDGTPKQSGDTVTYSYYYKDKLPAKAADAAENDPYPTTGPLFETVTIPSTFTNELFEKLGDDGFQITVVAHAIQADGFDTPAEAFKEYK